MVVWCLCVAKKAFCMCKHFAQGYEKVEGGTFYA